MLERERQSLAGGNPPTLTSVCTADATRPAHAPGRRSWQYFNHYVNAGRALWANAITMRSLELRLDYDALGCVARVAPTPLMLIVADDDDITPTSLALEAYASAREPRRLVMIHGHQYRPYLEAFDQSSQAAREWFLSYL